MKEEIQKLVEELKTILGDRMDCATAGGLRVKDVLKKLDESIEKIKQGK